ncbi:hypothetical protein UK23_35065 [Lentzea aerocolonigenes]|uniref:DUF5753 domain-containing protein n=1 Tax=Lentzea aerocolonigenes TaxID=68170 RepID=A0A0F0GHV8_LENAE|nr:hypothetical protein UK23_35065 [Lentzea aerocolonigenes]
MNGNAMALRLGWDPSKVSTIERGKFRPSEIDLVQYLTMCGKDIDFFNDFKRRYRNAFEEYIVQIPDNLRTVAMAESTAKSIMAYDGQTVPGLFQTPEYAQGVYRTAGLVTEERIPALVEFRTQRQAILRRAMRPTCLFYVHEHALRTKVGDEQVMAGQYARLLTKAFMIRIIPADTAVIASSCTLWEYEKQMSVAFVETDLANVFVQDPGAIVRTRLLFDRLANLALDAGQSRRVLAEYAGQPREDFDDAGTCMA